MARLPTLSSGARNGLLVGLACALLVAALLAIGSSARRPPGAVFGVATPYPTEDKPQSKLWFAHEHWWAWLPDGEASSLWRRGAAGWRRVTSLDAWLRTLPGRADVWAEGELARAVLVAPHQLATASLRYDPDRGTYVPHGEPVVWPAAIANPASAAAGPATPAGDAAAFWAAYEKHEPPIESATIARDGTGTWWIAYDFDKAIWVRHSLDREGLRWGEPLRLGGPISPDDISVLFAFPGAVGVVWGHQGSGEGDGVYFRRHLDGDPAERWEALRVVEQGYKVAEDHFNAAVGADGRVFVVTKDNKDVLGKGQLVLRVRDADGTWRNLPYAIRTESIMPTRPIALIGGEPARLYLVHSRYPRGEPRGEHTVVYRTVGMDLADLEREDRLLIPAPPGIDVRNATSTKQALREPPWVVLASDRFGNVYEGLIPAQPD